MIYSKLTVQAIRKYGVEACSKAYQMNQEGYGASGISLEGPPTLKTTRQADAAINAGAEIAKGRAFTASHGNAQGEDDEVESCSECGAALDDGEGYDGMCGSCADSAEEEHEDTDSLEDHGINLGSYGS